MTNLTEMLSKFVNSNTASSSSSGSLPSNTVTNPKEDLKGITTRSGVAYQGPTIPTSSPKVVERRTEVTKDTIFPTNNGITKDVQPLIILVENQNPVSEPVVAPVSAPMPNLKPSIPYPSRRNDEKRRENANEQKEKFYEIFKDMSFEISFMDALTLMPKFASTLKALIGNKEKISEMARTPLNEHCSTIILNKLPEKLGDPDIFLIPWRPFLRTAKALIDLYEEKLTLRVGSDELVFYAEKYEKSKNKQFAHAISVIDFLKDEPFSGSTTNHSNTLPPSSSPVKTSEILEEFADELTILKKGVHEENFQVYSNPLFKFDDDFNSSNENPLFNEMDKDVENENSNVSNSDKSVLLNTPLSDKVECSDPEDDIDEIDAFLAMEFSSNFEEGYFDSEGDVIFLENMLSDNTTHNLAPEVISDHESIHNTSITFSSRSDPLHHEFAGEIITLPSRIVREHEDYLSRMTLLCEISTSRSQENVHANPSSIIESLPVSLIPVEDSDPVQEEIDIFLVPDDLIPPGVENDDSEDEDNELPNLDHQDNPSSPRPPPEPPDVCLNFKPDTAMKNDEDFNQGEIVLSLNVEDVNSFTFVIWTFLPFFTYPEDSPVILSLRSEDLVFDPGISTFHFSLKPVPFALPKDE
ncbi:hypothetical protein Tco_0834244 [Tanacetum coccineum]